MAVTLIETVTAVSNGANPGVTVATLGTPSVSGELIIVVFSEGPNGTSPASITDNLGQTYTRISSDGLDSTFHYAFGWAYKEGSASGVTSVTMTDAAGETQGGLVVSHFTGALSSGSFETSSAIADGGTSPWASTTINTADNAVELLVGMAFAHNNGAGNTNIIPSGSWDALGSIVGGGGTFDGGNGQSLASSYQITSATGTYNNTGTITVSTADHVYCAVASFQVITAPPLIPIEQGHTIFGPF